jgi:hypothetical protein
MKLSQKRLRFRQLGGHRLETGVGNRKGSLCPWACSSRLLPMSFIYILKCIFKYFDEFLKHFFKDNPILRMFPYEYLVHAPHAHLFIYSYNECQQQAIIEQWVNDGKISFWFVGNAWKQELRCLVVWRKLMHIGSDKIENRGINSGNATLAARQWR